MRSISFRQNVKFVLSDPLAAADYRMEIRTSVENFL
jgi:hypothetical protein